MPRPKGAANVTRFEKRSRIETSNNKEIRHLVDLGPSPLKQFKDLLRHQENFLNWIDDRHRGLQEAKKALTEVEGGQKKGPKDAVYRKYRWYAEHLTLLEAINSFEVFYKQTLIALASALREFVPPGNIKGSIDGRVLWSTTGEVDIASLLFEHQLFHDLENVDKATQMLVNARRYNVNNPKSPLKETIKAIQAVFQIRHTLSHNGGLVTGSDSTKLKVYGYDASVEEVIDPTKEHLGKSVLVLLKDEASAFTDWLRKSTIVYVQEAADRNLLIPLSKKQTLSMQLGGGKDWDTVPWSE